MYLNSRHRVVLTLVLSDCECALMGLGSMAERTTALTAGSVAAAAADATPATLGVPLPGTKDITGFNGAVVCSVDDHCCFDFCDLGRLVCLWCI